MSEIQQLQGILNASGAMIASAAVVIPGFNRLVPFKYDLLRLQKNQAHLQSQLDRIRQDPSQNLGQLMIIGAGVVGMTALGGWIYKHFVDAKKLKTQADVYQGLKDDGTDSERAAQLAFGAGTDWTKFSRNLIILAAIGAGLYLFVKLR